MVDKRNRLREQIKANLVAAAAGGKDLEGTNLPLLSSSILHKELNYFLDLFDSFSFFPANQFRKLIHFIEIQTERKIYEITMDTFLATQLFVRNNSYFQVKIMMQIHGKKIRQNFRSSSRSFGFWEVVKYHLAVLAFSHLFINFFFYLSIFCNIQNCFLLSSDIFSKKNLSIFLKKRERETEREKKWNIEVQLNVMGLVCA